MIFYGRNVSKEALNSSYRVRKLLLQEGINTSEERIHEIITIARKKNVTIEQIGLKALNKLARSEDTQGVAVDVEFKISKLKDIQNHDDNDSYIYISAVTYEHNIGAIIRTSECGGLKGVIIPAQAEITSTVAKTSSGALFHIPIFQESIYNTIKFFKTQGYQISGIERGGQNYFDCNLTGNNLFIIGGEDKSLSDTLREKLDIITEIPQMGKVNSLNMSVAAAIIIFERIRQTFR